MKRLVVVADNSLIAEAVRLGLRSAGGFELLGYVNGQTASIRTITDADPDVVLLDDMDQSERAIELIRNLKEQEKDIAVMVLTGKLAGRWLERALAAGACGAISKSVQPNVVGTLVRETINGHIVHAALARSFDEDRDDRAELEPGKLTQRESEILRLVAGGRSNGAIARTLWVAEPTVKFHLRNIYRKLGVANRTEACHFAHTNGMLDDLRDSPVAAPALAS